MLDPLAIGNSSPSAIIAAVVGNGKPKRERPLCSHWDTKSYRRQVLQVTWLPTRLQIQK